MRRREILSEEPVEVLKAYETATPLQGQATKATKGRQLRYLILLTLEEFPQAGRDMFGEGFQEIIRTRSETAKTLLQAVSV